jgi:hypothetical protein
MDAMEYQMAVIGAMRINLSAKDLAAGPGVQIALLVLALQVLLLRLVQAPDTATTTDVMEWQKAVIGAMRVNLDVKPVVVECGASIQIHPRPVQLQLQHTSKLKALHQFQPLNQPVAPRTQLACFS